MSKSFNNYSNFVTKRFLIYKTKFKYEQENIIHTLYNLNTRYITNTNIQITYRHDQRHTIQLPHKIITYINSPEGSLTLHCRVQFRKIRESTSVVPQRPPTTTNNDIVRPALTTTNVRELHQSISLYIALDIHTPLQRCYC